MPSRRDQLHAYQFMTQRVVAAFVLRETDPVQSPLRRGIGALFGGLMVAVLVAAGYGVYGLLTRVGTDAWRSEGAVVVERESGAAFVFRQGRLHPALNYASARLAAGRPGARVFRVAARELDEVPRGVVLGIPGAPASLPGAARAVGLPWTVCAVPGPRPSTVLLVAAAGPAVAPLGERGLLLRDAAAGVTYLVWHGRKHLVQDSRTTVPALFGAVQATAVGTAWLNALPSGVDVAAPAVPDRGAASPAVPGRRNGDVLVAATASGRQFYLVLPDGLAPVTPLQQAVLAARYPAPPVPVDVAAAARVPVSGRLAEPDPALRPPAAAPPLAAAAGEPVCAVTTTAAGPAGAPAAAQVTVGGPVPALAAAVPTTGVSETGRPLADAVLVPAGTVEVVRASGAAGWTVVTDVGVRHAVPSAQALALLGYAADAAVPVPAALLDLLPEGVTLDPDAAARPAPPG